MKACCPEGHYGPNCEPCLGFPDNVCNNRGYCSGNGSRDGSGQCVCNTGFKGINCNQCDKKFYQKINESSDELICNPCDNSCADSCRSGGPKGCLVCKNGYIWDNDYGCYDINECLDIGVDPCLSESNTFCVNTEGSFHCYRKCFIGFNMCYNYVKQQFWDKCARFKKQFSK